MIAACVSQLTKRRLILRIAGTMFGDHYLRLITSTVHQPGKDQAAPRYHSELISVIFLWTLSFWAYGCHSERQRRISLPIVWDPSL